MAKSKELLRMLRDPNLRFPPAPRLVADIHVFVMPDGLGIQLRGGESTVLLRGASVVPVSEYLIHSLDGTRTLDSLLAERPQNLSEEVVLQTLSLLHFKGLLTGDLGDISTIEVSNDLDSSFNSRQLQFWGRNLGVTRSASQAKDIELRTKNSKLVLVAAGMIGAATYDLLTRAGFTNVYVIDWDDDGLCLETIQSSCVSPVKTHHCHHNSIAEITSVLQSWIIGADLLLTAIRNGPDSLFSALNSMALQFKVPWLRGSINASICEIGPSVFPFDTGCFTCMRLRRISMDNFSVEEKLYQDEISVHRLSGILPPLGESLIFSSLFSSLIASEVLRIVTRIAQPLLINSVLQCLPLSGEHAINKYQRVPRCPDCYHD